jgi:hypothetical protein
MSFGAKTPVLPCDMGPQNNRGCRRASVVTKAGTFDCWVRNEPGSSREREERERSSQHANCGNLSPKGL